MLEVNYFLSPKRLLKRMNQLSLTLKSSKSEQLGIVKIKSIYHISLRPFLLYLPPKLFGLLYFKVNGHKGRWEMGTLDKSAYF